MKANKKDIKKCGIYCIRNIINNKVYIGKSKNINKRIIAHRHYLENKNVNENRHLINSWHKYGSSNFEYFVIEYLEQDDKLVSERELYWMKKFKSLSRDHGYNLRCDSQTSMIVHLETSKKISNRLKKEWVNGVRSNHSKKLSKNWENNPDRKILQSEIMTKNLTKYLYKLYDLDNNFIEECTYKRLVELKIKNVIVTFYKKKSNIVKFKNFLIERVIIKDIV